jgi:hypothetical protein
VSEVLIIGGQLRRVSDRLAEDIRLWTLIVDLVHEDREPTCDDDDRGSRFAAQVVLDALERYAGDK